jgi:hypothetical protein
MTVLELVGVGLQVVWELTQAVVILGMCLGWTLRD